MGKYISVQFGVSFHASFQLMMTNILTFQKLAPQHTTTVYCMRSEMINDHAECPRHWASVTLEFGQK